MTWNRRVRLRELQVRTRPPLRRRASVIWTPHPRGKAPASAGTYDTPSPIKSQSLRRDRHRDRYLLRACADIISRADSLFYTYWKGRGLLIVTNYFTFLIRRCQYFRNSALA